MHDITEHQNIMSALGNCSVKGVCVWGGGVQSSSNYVIHHPLSHSPILEMVKSCQFVYQSIEKDLRIKTSWISVCLDLL